jgi:tricorn protease-like protein
MQASITLLNTLEAHVDEVALLLFSLDGKILAACDESMITLWDTATGALRTTIEEQDEYFYDIAFSPDNKWIAAASREGNGRIWSTDTGEIEQNISVPEECMLSIVFSPDSRSVVTGSEVLRVWNVGTGDLEHTRSLVIL